MLIDITGQGKKAGGNLFEDMQRKAIGEGGVVINRNMINQGGSASHGYIPFKMSCGGEETLYTEEQPYSYCEWWGNEEADISHTSDSTLKPAITIPTK